MSANFHTRSPLVKATDDAIARENKDPQGLPQDVLADMEADILANADKYPELHRLLTDPEYRAQRRAEGPR
jgi:hypothetical protein